jgi:GDPmannose 4,6-dehydratase
MKKALITGVTGQDGYYLAEFLLQKGYAVVGICPNQRERQGAQEFGGQIEYIEGDVTNESFMYDTLSAHKPDEVYNLAALVMTAEPWREVLQVTQVSAIAPLYMLEWIRAKAPQARFFQASSSEMYGATVESPQRETTPCIPQNPYGTAKLFAHQMTGLYRKYHGLFVVSGILFNHESPRRDSRFVTRKITSALSRIKKGSQEVLELGNLDSTRDWSFAGDIIRGMWLSLQHESAEDYVFASGESHTVREFVETAARVFDIPLRWEGSGVEEKAIDKNGKVIVAVDPRLFRTVELSIRQGDTAKARSQLGWQPEISFTQLVEMMVRAEQ